VSAPFGDRSPSSDSRSSESQSPESQSSGSRRSDGGVTSASFDDLVAAATIGLSRKPLAVTELIGPAEDGPAEDGPAATAVARALDGGDQATALLDAAALLTVARRAGWRAGPGATRAQAAPEEAAPEWSPRAERALRQLGGAHLAPGFAAADKELLADLLTAAIDAGYVASAPVLPDLLDAAVRTAALRTAVAAVLGARGRWLAAHRPDWQRVVDAAPVRATRIGAVAAGPAGTAATPTWASPETWRTGSRAERQAYLAALRERDPEAGRELVAADWARLSADERAALLAVLARGLSADDEEFLDGVLDDRAGGVHAVARRLLTRLPGSRFSQRAMERAAAVLQVERDGPGRRLTVSRPEDPDPAAVRDGIDVRLPAPSIGRGGWLLTQLIAAAPLAGWTRLFGLSPAEIVSLPMAPHHDAARLLDVHAGWRLAAVSQGGAEWAEALLAAGDPDDGGGRPPSAWPDDQRLAATLPPARRAARAAALLAGTRPTPGPAVASYAIAEVGGVPMPWPGGLADAVLAVLGRAAPLAALPRLPRGLLDLAARGLPATGGRDYAAELTRLADAHPQTWTPLVRKTAETILLRRAFLEEIR
jgi:Family of unknown function (DUF5691)